MFFNNSDGKKVDFKVRTFPIITKSALLEAAEKGHNVALMFMDIDEFKNMNDIYGHDTGDQLLIQYAERIRTLASDENIVARLGGDEFIVLMRELHSLQEIEKLALNLLQSLREPWKLKDEAIMTTSSIGISIYPEHGDDIKVLMKKADEALYVAKDKGKNRYEIYSKGDCKWH